MNGAIPYCTKCYLSLADLKYGYIMGKSINKLEGIVSGKKGTVDLRDGHIPIKDMKMPWHCSNSIVRTYDQLNEFDAPSLPGKLFTVEAIQNTYNSLY